MTFSLMEARRKIRRNFLGLIISFLSSHSPRRETSFFHLMLMGAAEKENNNEEDREGQALLIVCATDMIYGPNDFAKLVCCVYYVLAP